MVKINIPDEAAEVIRASNQKTSAEQLQTSICEAIASPKSVKEIGRQLEAVSLPDETPVDSTFLTRCLKNEIERRKENSSGGDYNPEFFPSAIRRPKVFVARRASETEELRYVSTAEHLEHLLNEITNISLESAYVGHDCNDVIVLRCELPQAYVARVPYIKLAHIPMRFFQTDSVVCKKMPPKLPHKKGELYHGESVVLCRELEPVWTDKPLYEIKQATIATYNCVTLKIRKEDHTLKSWFPGIDKDSAPCQTLEGTFVLVGPHFDSTGQVYKNKKAAVASKLTLGDIKTNQG
jgi:hypothetical protein